MSPKSAYYYRDAIAEKVSCNYNQDTLENNLLSQIEYYPKLDMLFEDDKKMKEIQNVFMELSKNKGKFQEIDQFTNKIKCFLKEFMPKMLDITFIFNAVKSINTLNTFFAQSTRLLIKYMKIIARQYFDADGLKT